MPPNTTSRPCTPRPVRMADPRCPTGTSSGGAGKKPGVRQKPPVRISRKNSESMRSPDRRRIVPLIPLTTSCRATPKSLCPTVYSSKSISPATNRRHWFTPWKSTTSIPAHFNYSISSVTPKREEDDEDDKEVWALYYVDGSFDSALDLIDSALLTIERKR